MHAGSRSTQRAFVTGFLTVYRPGSSVYIPRRRNGKANSLPNVWQVSNSSSGHLVMWKRKPKCDTHNANPNMHCFFFFHTAAFQILILNKIDLTSAVINEFSDTSSTEYHSRIIVAFLYYFVLKVVITLITVLYMYGCN